MAKPSLEQWKNQIIGKKIDLDNQSYDCVDVSKSWAEFVTGKGWQTSLGWGNAKDIWNNAPSAYWDRVSEPQLGDIVCMGAAIGGGFGHTGVVIAINGGNITIAQQNTFTQQAVYTGVYSAHASYIQGYLHSKVAFDVGLPVVLADNQRVTNDVVNYRSAANRNAGVLVTDSLPSGQLVSGETYDFKGFVHGENVDGNDVWFVGAYTGGYAWSGGFTDTGTHGLADFTPASISATQRQVAGDAMNLRRTPLVAPDNVIRVISAGETVDCVGFKHGMNVDGNDIWFKTADGYIWSGGFTDTSTHNLTEEVSSTPTPPADPVYTFEKDLACVTEVVPAGYLSFEHGNFPANPEKVVIHDFGTKNVDTIGSVVPYFQKRDNISAHFVVSGKRIVQMVSLNDRAYHAGKDGNGFVGIESDPIQDADTIASTNLVLDGLEKYYGYRLTPIKHSSIMPTLCGDDINLDNYAKKPVETPPPVVTPPVPTKPIIKLADIKTVLVNMGITFIQAFTAVWALTGYKIDKGALGGAIGAGLSVVWNTIIKPYLIAKDILKK